MTKPVSAPTPVDLRQRMIEDTNVRGFCDKTQHEYLRIVSRFAIFLGRLSRHGDRRGCPPVPGCPARGGYPGAAKVDTPTKMVCQNGFSLWPPPGRPIFQ